MSPAERNLHQIAATFCAPSIRRTPCPQCGGAGIIPTSTLQRPELHDERCSACAGTGRLVTEWSRA